MSLVTYAAPFEEYNNNKLKPTAHKINTKKVNTLLNKIHDTFDSDDNLCDFKPPPMPKSSGVQKRLDKEGFNNKNVPEYSEIYTDKIPEFKEYTPQREYIIPSIYQNSNHSNSSNNDIINKKLNDIITLLKEQKDNRTEHVTEEIILYSFFGIFIIYLVDSFKKVGKYTR